MRVHVMIVRAACLAMRLNATKNRAESPVPAENKGFSKIPLRDGSFILDLRGVNRERVGLLSGSSGAQCGTITKGDF
jgi:hypothetical protein